METICKEKDLSNLSKDNKKKFKNLSDQIVLESKAFNFSEKILANSIGLSCGILNYKPELEKRLYFKVDKQIKLSKKADIELSIFRAQIDCIVRNNSSLLSKCNLMFLFELKNLKDFKYTKVEFIKPVNKKEEESQSTLNLKAIEPRYTIDQIIVNEKTSKGLLNTVVLIKNRNKIYKEWGFEEIDPVPHSVINFFGPPGTGKTMSAHIIASELKIKIIPLNYADVESKFVGEAPKNLVAAFEKAKKENALLFFDEADSFLGKRITNVSSSSDQAVNSLRSQLLILLETYDVITIFATNLQENYDKAFNSRILKHIQFELPDCENRKKLIKKMIPSKVPFDRESVSPEFYDKLSTYTEGFAPREIKNAVLNTLVEGCTKEVNIDEQLFISCFINSREVNLEINKIDLSSQKKEKYGKKIKEAFNKNDYVVSKTLQGKGEEVEND